MSLLLGRWAGSPWSQRLWISRLGVQAPHWLERLLKNLFKKIFLNLFIHERHTEREAETGQREKQAPFTKPDVGFDPRSLGSRPEPKADTQPLSHPGVPIVIFKVLPDFKGFGYFTLIALIGDKLYFPVIGALE